MKKIESVLYKVSTGGLIALVPFIQYWSSTSNIANATIPNDVLDFSNAEVSKYIKFQSSDPLFNYTTYQNSNNSRNLTIDELADLSIGIRITNQTTFESAFNGGYGDEHGDVKLDTLIYSLNCVDNSIDIGLTPRDTNTNILLNYVNSS
jgi:hypothetical protein